MKDTMGKNQDDSNEPIRHTSSNTSPIHKKPLTPTKDHPLMDLEKKKPAKSEFMDDSDDANDDIILVQLEDTKPHDVGSCKMTFNETNKISPEPDNFQAKTIITSNADETNNNNTQVNEESGSRKLPSDSINQKKSSSRMNVDSANMKNNNRMSSSIGTEDSQHKNEDGLTKSTDKLNGKIELNIIRFLVLIEQHFRRNH